MRHSSLRTALLLCLSTARAHTWFPDGWVQRHENASGRELTTSGCTSPAWSTAATSGVTTAFSSFHLHLAWAAGNPAQVAAVAAFKAALISVANASSSCASLTDSSTYFCYSQTITSYASAAKQDPFYNQGELMHSRVRRRLACAGQALRHLAHLPPPSSFFAAPPPP
jgi:hypothetical protein